MNKNLTVLRCPKCGYEYLPCEIYLPEVFLGQAKSINRGVDNKIVFCDDNMNLEEEYVCDSCNTKFKVYAKVSFLTEVVKDDFEEEYSSDLYLNDRFTLSEN